MAYNCVTPTLIQTNSLQSSCNLQRRLQDSICHPSEAKGLCPRYRILPFAQNDKLLRQFCNFLITDAVLVMAGGPVIT